MLNRDKIVKYFNEKTGKRLSPNHEKMVAAFGEMDAAGITESALMQAIADGIITEKEDLLDVFTLKSIIGETTPAAPAAPAAPAPMDFDNPFGAFLSGISATVNNETDRIVEEKFREWIAAHEKEFDRVRRERVVWECHERGGEMKEVTHELFDDIRKIVAGNVYAPLLVGPAGTGKNHVAEQVAKLYNLEFYFTGAVTQEYQLTGFIDANGVYHKTQFYEAFTKGGLFFFDEMDNSDPFILKRFNSATGNKYFDFPTGRVKAHENFRVIGAANTYGDGASMDYCANELDGSTLNRFLKIPFGYDANIEESLTADMGLVEFMRTFRDACENDGVRCIVSYRQIEQCDAYVDSLGVEKCLQYSLLGNMTKDDMRVLLDAFDGMNNKWADGFRKIARG